MARARTNRAWRQDRELSMGGLVTVGARLELFFRRLDADRSGPVIENIQLLCRRLREVDLSTSRVGSAVVDLDLDLLAILEIGDGGLGAQWQPGVRRR